MILAHNSYYCPFHARQKPTGVPLIVNARNVAGIWGTPSSVYVGP